METIKTHPIYDNYEFSSLGKGKRIGNDFWLNIKPRKNISLTSIDGQKKQMLIHRAIYEAFKGVIPAGLEIDHIDDDFTNNRIENLQAISMQENRKKAQKNNQAFRLKACHHAELKRPVEGEHLESHEKHHFVSKTQAGRYYGCSPALIYLIAEHKNNCKSFGNTITFRYIDQVDPNLLIKYEHRGIGVKHIKKISNVVVEDNETAKQEQ